MKSKQQHFQPLQIITTNTSTRPKQAETASKFAFKEPLSNLACQNPNRDPLCTLRLTKNGSTNFKGCIDVNLKGKWPLEGSGVSNEGSGAKNSESQEVSLVPLFYKFGPVPPMFYYQGPVEKKLIPVQRFLEHQNKIMAQIAKIANMPVVDTKVASNGSFDEGIDVPLPKKKVAQDGSQYIYCQVCQLSIQVSEVDIYL